MSKPDSSNGSGPPAVPNLFIIGAPKCGTTSLHRYLDCHPEVSMSSRKEPHVLAYDDWRDRVRRYDEWLDRSPPVRGEASTGYSAFPWAPDVPDRIKEIAPMARIVYVVGDPVERVVSHYQENVAYGWRREPFGELLERPEDPENIPLWASRYATQLERYLARFPGHQVLVVDQDRLRAERGAVLRELFAFVGIDPDFTTPAFDVVHRERSRQRRPNSLGRVVQRTTKVAVGPVLAARDGRGAALLRGVLTSPQAPVRLTGSERARLAELLAPEAERFRQLTGMSFPRWSV